MHTTMRREQPPPTDVNLPAPATLAGVPPAGPPLVFRNEEEDVVKLNLSVYRNEEEDVVKLNLSTRWFDKIKFSSWFSLAFYTTAGLAMETSKVESFVRNQAKAKLNQLEHSESAGTIRTSCKR
ncbi:hypothetical protein F511_35487 [Dorcoceras hygrometricum]|uniref:Uncharacterized protein n=1 Tax=Dorcoceras hygrometricum TaxID=472368 RepID=A0A2Z7BCX1_9LAMI|nr:hypothetical protein F511_35487 [Dorcoceras hygrometricum]